MLLGIQIVAILFGIFMIYITFINLKKREFTTKEAFAWIILWLGIMFVALFPNSLDFLVKGILKLQRPLDFFIILGFIFLIGASFYTYSLVRKNEKQIDEIVRKTAIKKEEEDVH